MNDRALMSQLRSLAGAAQSPQLWSQIMELLRAWPATSLDFAIDYVETAARRWPDGLRRNASWMTLDSGHRAWRLIRHLDLEASPLTPRDVEAIVQHSAMAWITQVTLAGCGIGDRGLLRILDALESNLGSATNPIEIYKLDLRDNGLTPEGASTLAGSEVLGEIEALDLSGNAISDSALAQIILAMAKPMTIAARDTGAGLLTTEAIADTPATQLMAGLDLSNNRVDARAAIALARAEGLGRLAHLQLSSNPLGDEGAQALADSPMFPTLRQLTLARCGIGPLGIAALAQSPHLTTLRSLDIRENTIDPFCARLMVKTPELRGLETFLLSYEGEEVDGVEALAALLV